jgi:hypothetical protein
MNDHKPDIRPQDEILESLLVCPVDHGPSNPYDPGPGDDDDASPDAGQFARIQRNPPRKQIPPSLLEQMSRDELERYNAMGYSKQEGYVAQLLVREKNFRVEESVAWRTIVSINCGRPPTSVQVRRFLQCLERLFNMKVSREDKRYRTNGIMWIDEHWDTVGPHIHLMTRIPRDPAPLAPAATLFVLPG